MLQGWLLSLNVIGLGGWSKQLDLKRLFVSNNVDVVFQRAIDDGLIITEEPNNCIDTRKVEEPYGFTWILPYSIKYFPIVGDHTQVEA